MVDRIDSLPPGWESKYDMRTGRWYYINHRTKTTTFEDPRNARATHSNNTGQPAAGEYIPLQHGSPDLRRNYIYPSQPSPIPAFQMPGYCQKYIPLQDMKSTLRSSPLMVRTAKVQDSSFTTFDTDESVAKISAMFTTASEAHIRLLLKKYHNREAVVISALQVEKHPLTTPGPFSTPPPSLRNHPHTALSAMAAAAVTSRTGSPRLTASGSSSSYTGSPQGALRPHSSPKLKLRYMKSIFPQADETMILDMLSSNENNIQKTSDCLREMGFMKKDTFKVCKQSLEAKAAEELIKKEQEELLNSPPPPQKLATLVEKATMFENIKKQYKDIPDRVITIAMESVEFDEERANQILQIMVQDENKSKEENSDKVEITQVDSIQVPNSVSTSQSRQSLKSLLKSKDKNRISRVIEENNIMNSPDYKSTYLSSNIGANTHIVNGANEKLLLEDYVKWQGPNRNLLVGPQHTLAKGPNKELLTKRGYQACGPNRSLCKGSSYGLAKGSIFALNNAPLVDECRGK